MSWSSRHHRLERRTGSRQELRGGKPGGREVIDIPFCVAGGTRRGGLQILEFGADKVSINSPPWPIPPLITCLRRVLPACSACGGYRLPTSMPPSVNIRSNSLLGDESRTRTTTWTTLGW